MEIGSKSRRQCKRRRGTAAQGTCYSCSGKPVSGTFLAASRTFDGGYMRRRLGLALQAIKNPDELLTTVLPGCGPPALFPSAADATAAAAVHAVVHLLAPCPCSTRRDAR